MSEQIQSTSNPETAGMPVSMAVAPSTKDLSPAMAGMELVKKATKSAVRYQPDPAKDRSYYSREITLCWNKAISGILSIEFC